MYSHQVHNQINKTNTLFFVLRCYPLCLQTILIITLGTRGTILLTEPTGNRRYVFMEWCWDVRQRLSTSDTIGICHGSSWPDTGYIYRPVIPCYTHIGWRPTRHLAAFRWITTLAIPDPLLQLLPTAVPAVRVTYYQHVWYWSIIVI